MKISVAFVYPDSPWFTPTHYDTTAYHFFFEALLASNELEISYFKTKADEGIDCRQLKDIDIVLSTMPPELVNKVFRNRDPKRLPLVLRVGEPYHMKPDRVPKCENVYCFGFYQESYFHRHYPRALPYSVIVHGLEERLYANLKPFDERRKDKILSSGSGTSVALWFRIVDKIKHPNTDIMRFYALRNMATRLTCVEYVRPKTQSWDYTGDGYPRLLQQFCASIAATTTNPSLKYWEVPAANCLTFMEVTGQNEAGEIGFEDGVHAIWINMDNYKQKFREYIDHPDNPLWKEIADSGRKLAIENFGNRVAVDKLTKLCKSIADGNPVSFGSWKA